MRRRLLTVILSVTAVAVLLFAAPLAIVVRELVDEDATLRLERQAVLAAREVPADFATSPDPVEMPDGEGGTTLGLYAPDGRLAAGSGPGNAEAAVLAALDNRVVEVRTGGIRLAAVPVAADEQVIGVIRAEQPTSASDRRSLGLLALLGASAAVVLVVAAAIGALLAGRLATPVRRLRDAAVELGRGTFAVEVPPSRIPELDEAADALTATGRRLQDLVARERAFSDDASHQLRTPVAGLRAALETELAFPREDRVQVLLECLEDVDRLEATITELLRIARGSTRPGAAVELGQVLAAVEPVWRRRLEGEGRRLVVRVPRHLPAVDAEATMVRHVLDVLLDNARTHGEGEVSVEATDRGEEVVVLVDDEGVGFPDPMTDGDGECTQVGGQPHGLGLPLARRYVEAMGGRIDLGRPGSPARVEVAWRRAHD